MRIEVADHAPDFVAFCVEEDKSWGEIKLVHGGEFHTRLILNVQANKLDFFAKFCFELVNDGLNCCAANSIRRLEFEQHGRAITDHFLHFFGIFHERGLAGMQDRPRGE